MARKPCTVAPQMWDEPNEWARAICRRCPFKVECAKQACETPWVSGVLAGIYLPPGELGPHGIITTRPRRHALTRLRHIAEVGGLEVHPYGYPGWRSVA